MLSVENGQPVYFFPCTKRIDISKVHHLELVHCEILKHYGSIQYESKKKSYCCSQRPPLFCVGMYEYTHVVMPGKKKDLKLAFPVRRFLWPVQFGKLREILNE